MACGARMVSTYFLLTNDPGSSETWWMEPQRPLLVSSLPNTNFHAHGRYGSGRVYMLKGSTLSQGDILLLHGRLGRCRKGVGIGLQGFWKAARNWPQNSLLTGTCSCVRGNARSLLMRQVAYESADLIWPVTSSQACRRFVKRRRTDAGSEQADDPVPNGGKSAGASGPGRPTLFTLANTAARHARACARYRCRSLYV